MPPITVMIKPASSLCNMRCRYCFYADVANNRAVKSYGIMDFDTLENVVRKAYACTDSAVTFVFQGGEPTLAGLGFYKKLIELERIYNKNNIQTNNSLQTNGLLLDEEWAELFAKNNFLIGVSVDGTKEIHDSMRVDDKGNGTFERIEENIRVLEKYKVEFNILCVVNNIVAKEGKKVYNALKKYKYLQFIPCIDSFDGEKREYSLDPVAYGRFLNEVFDLYYRDFMNGRYVSVRNFDNYVNLVLGAPPENCAMNGFCAGYFLVEGDGSVYPCDFYVLDEWKLGNINTESFIRMMKGERIQTFRQTSQHIDEKCKSCEWYALCRGGCRRNREPFVNDRPSLNIFCEGLKMFFDESYDKINKMANELKRRNF